MKPIVIAVRQIVIAFASLVTLMNMHTHVAAADEWTIVQDTTEKKLYYNFNNVYKYNDDIVRIWSKAFMNGTTINALEEYNCKERYIRVVDFNVNGRPVAKKTIESYGTQYIEPKTVRDQVLIKICNNTNNNPIHNITEAISWDDDIPGAIRQEILKDLLAINKFGWTQIVLYKNADSVFDKRELKSYITTQLKDKFSNYSYKDDYPLVVSNKNDTNIWLRIWISEGLNPVFQIKMKIFIDTTTIWEREAIGYSSGDMLTQNVKKTISSIIDKFSDDYAYIKKTQN